MDKTNVEAYVGPWIDNSHGVYPHDGISLDMRQIALKLGVPESKLPTIREIFAPFAPTEDFSFGRYHDEWQREMEDLLNEYCTTDLTSWYWHENAFGLWAEDEKEA